MSDKRLREITLAEYVEKFALEGANNENNKKAEALKYALDIRKFEIDLYWKRATYFWTFIGAAMAGYFLIQKTEGPTNTYLSVIAGCLGFLFSFAWFYVNKGSKYWQENWENHVDLIEDYVVGPLYKTVIHRPEEDETKSIRDFVTGPAAYSVSKINQIVSLFVGLLWVVLVFQALPPFDRCAPIEWKYVVPIGLTILTCFVMWRWGKTDKSNYKGLVATLRQTTIQKEG